MTRVQTGARSRRLYTNDTNSTKIPWPKFCFIENYYDSIYNAENRYPFNILSPARHIFECFSLEIFIFK